MRKGKIDTDNDNYRPESRACIHNRNNDEIVDTNGATRE